MGASSVLGALLTAATKEVDLGSMCTNSPMFNSLQFRRPHPGALKRVRADLGFPERHPRLNSFAQSWAKSQRQTICRLPPAGFKRTLCLRCHEGQVKVWLVFF